MIEINNITHRKHSQWLPFQTFPFIGSIYKLGKLLDPNKIVIFCRQSGPTLEKNDLTHVVDILHSFIQVVGNYLY